MIMVQTRQDSGKLLPSGIRVFHVIATLLKGKAHVQLLPGRVPPAGSRLGAGGSVQAAGPCLVFQMDFVETASILKYIF